ncbi:MAG TPA: VOC family protein [Fimbriiglobus sp.]|nr:VOC family protein [Fimbriiglobus sp.]
MSQSISAVALVVHDYDEAIRFFTLGLGFGVVEDTPLAPGRRWVTVRPAAAPPSCWRRRPPRGRRPGSATRPAGGCSSSSTPTTSGGTTMR